MSNESRRFVVSQNGEAKVEETGEPSPIGRRSKKTLIFDHNGQPLARDAKGNLTDLEGNLVGVERVTGRKFYADKEGKVEVILEPKNNNLDEEEK